MNSNINDKDIINGEVDLLEVLHVLWNRIVVLILCFLIGAGAAGAGTKFLITPQYEATSTIYIYSKSTSITSLTDLQIGSSLAVDFKIIGTTRGVVEKVIDELSLNTTYEKLVKTITVDNPTSSHMLTITVKNPDPKLAADISNSLADVLREQISEVMSTDKPSSVERAVVPQIQCSPNVKKNTAIGGILFSFCAAAIILIKYFADDTVQTEEDVTRYLGLNTLAAVPIEHGLEKSEKQDTRTSAVKQKRRKE